MPRADLVDLFFIEKIDAKNVLVRCSECSNQYRQNRRQWIAKLSKTGKSRCIECSKKFAISQTQKKRLQKRIETISTPDFADQLVDPSDYVFFPKTSKIRFFCKTCSTVESSRKDHLRSKFARMGALYCDKCAHLNAKDYDRVAAYIKFIKTIRSRYNKAVLPSHEVKRLYDKKRIKKQQKFSADQKKEKSHYDKSYRKRNKQKIIQQKKQRIITDINFKISLRIRQRLNIAARSIKSGSKRCSAVKDLGCTVPELKAYLESKFQEGMSWDNWSRTGWHIDHIIPLCKFNLADEEEAKKACHYTNLQPLWAADNISKGGRWPSKH